MLTFLNLLKKLLETITKISIPPTWTARTLYMFCSCVVYGMSFITDIKFIDNYQISEQKINININDSDKNNFIISFSILSLGLLNQNLQSDYLKNFIENELIFLIDNTPIYKEFSDANLDLIGVIGKRIEQYYNFRNNDGWLESNEQINLPNGEYKINPSNPIDTGKITDYKCWCPLDSQQMVGATWGKVMGLIDENNFNQIEKELIEIYKSIDIVQEAKQVLDISLELTQEQKCIAEFWAGIGGSVAPPGFWNMFLLCCFKSSCQNDYFTQLKYFYQLNCGLFQVSLVIWNIKYKCIQARPIQTIRLLFPELEFDYYFGHSKGNMWLPYQETRLWTPPFCDYLSGHSGFSSVGAYFMNKFFGPEIANMELKITSDELKLLSPLYKNYSGTPLDLSLIMIDSKCSNIDKSLPTEPVYLVFNTWDEMAESAGISRIFGGIHYMSSNIISLDIGRQIGKLIDDKFNNF